MTSRSRLKHDAHDGARAVLRVVGPLLILVGGAMFVTGILSFFEKFDERIGGSGHNLPEVIRNLTPEGEVESEPRSPNRFWMCFVGAPVAMVGFALSKYGYLGAAARYVAAETAPVAKDTINYVVDGTKESIRDAVSAVRDDDPSGTPCPNCGRGNDADAKFCDECGTALARACPNCRETNDADAKFCDACGTAL